MSDLPNFDSSQATENASDAAFVANEHEIDRELEEFDQQFGPSLAQILQPPADLKVRAQQRATSDLLDRSMLGAASDLLTVGWQTMWCIFGTERANEQPDSSREEQHHA